MLSLEWCVVVFPQSSRYRPTMSSSVEPREAQPAPASPPARDGDSTEQHAAPAGTDVYVQASDSEKTVIRAGGVFDVDPNLSKRLAARDSANDLVGHELDHFQIESLVGTGGMGAVYRGRDLRLDRIVAVKVVPIADRGAEAMRRFRVEAQSAAKLDHPNIARVYYVGETQHWSYIVFEFVEGTNLREIVLQQGLLTVDEAVCFTRQVAEALQHACERGVVHRDIKPSNILVTNDGQAKVVDMGLARTTELDRSTNDLTASGVTLGTFDYISPEQAHDPRDADVRSDIYSLGCTLYFLLTGQPPFPEGTALQKLLMHGTKMPEDPRYFRNDLSDSLIAILRKMMAKRPADRYQEPNDLINDLHTLAEVDGLVWTLANDNPAARSSVANRTWFEALLPFVASLAVIVVVTLWLHNTNQLSAVFQIPRVDILDAAPSSTTSAIAQENTASSKGTVSSKGIGERTAESTSVVPTSNLAVPSSDNATALSNSAVSPDKEKSTTSTPNIGNETPAELSMITVDESSAREASTSKQPAARGISGSIEDALSKVGARNNVKAIEFKSTSLTTTLSSQRTALTIPSAITMRSAASGRCRWIIDSTSTTSYFAAIQCGPQQLVLSDIDIVWRAAAGNSRERALFSVQPGGGITLNNCTITVVSASRQTLPTLIQVEAEPVDSRSDTRSVAPAMSSVQIDCTNLVVRGHCDWVRMQSPVRIESQIENGWFAIAGSVFDLSGSKIQSRAGVTLRTEWRNVTCYSAKPWMRLAFNNMQSSPISIIRTSRDSVYMGCDTLIEWDATECDDWLFWEQNKDRGNLARWIDLRGADNAYDAATVKNVFGIRMKQKQPVLFPIDGDSDLLADERGVEYVVRWKSQPRIEAENLAKQSVEAFQQLAGAFQSGFLLNDLPKPPVNEER